MGKRTSDRQMTKDDYEQEADSPEIKQGFQRASDGVLSQRKIRKVTSARKSKSASPPSGGFGGGVFANVKLGGSKPPAAVPGFIVDLNAVAPVQMEEPGLTDEKKSKLSTLTKNFLEHCSNLGDRTYDPIGTERFLVTYLSIQNPRSEAPAPAAPASNPVARAPAPSAPAPALASNLFSGSTASAAPAPAPATSNLFGTSPGQQPTFSFGGTNAPAPAAPALFGGSPAAAAPATSASSLFPPSATTNNDDNNKAEGSSTTFGGFSTAASPAVAAAVAAPAPASHGEDDNAPQDDGGTETAARNPDANVEAQFECDGKVFQVVEKDGKSDRENLGVGHLKLERNAQTGKSQLVIRDTTTGAVKFNMAMSKDLRFSESKQKNKLGKVTVTSLVILDAAKGPETLFFYAKDKNAELCGALNAFAQSS